jgi:2-haloalkanoic acid dehalogenase type II
MGLEAEWITFDCFGTLIDWDSGIRSFFRTLPGVQGEAIDLLLTDWEELQFSLINGPYLKYRNVMHLSLQQTMAKYGVVLSAATLNEFVESLPAWQPFPDVHPTLRRLQECGFKLGIISNIDEDLLERTIKTLAIRLDLVMTAERCRAYKPSVRPFESALEQMGCTPSSVAHVAFGDRYDLGPARQCGMQTVYVNRQGKTASVRPDLEVASLAELPALIRRPRIGN